MKKICIVTTVSSSIDNWIKPFLNEYSNRNIDVSIACNMSEDYKRNLLKQFPFVHAYPISFPRGINAIGSLKGIFGLIKIFSSNHFDMVQYSTPNASMYASIASWITRVPVRLYCQWGMVYVTMSGLKREIFRAMENFVCNLSTDIQPDSQGNLLFCREQGFYNESKSCVIWNGSAKGLDLSAFDVTKKAQYAEEIKSKYDIPWDAPVVGFVGRLGKEKGCNELIKAFQGIKAEFPKAKLLFVGPIEKEETIEPDLLEYFRTCEDIIKTDRVTHVEKYTSAMDVFVLPSYREGFGMSVIEASAMEVPVIVTEYPGPSSAMEEGITGYAIRIADVEALKVCIADLFRNPHRAREMGEAGRKFVTEKFDQQVFIEKYMQNREALLSRN